MYIPQSLNPDQLIYAYDINNLYPSSMLYNKFPVGKIMQFEGDPTILADSLYYWIGDVEVSTKKDLYRPYIQIHHNITGKSGDMRTLSPNGSFNMKINSPEYYNALEDYNFKFKNGYIFKK
jgi:DNA polymerase type B, organellar and viral